MKWPWSRDERDPDPALVDAQRRVERVSERADKVGAALAERRLRNNFAEGLGFRPFRNTGSVT